MKGQFENRYAYFRISNNIVFVNTKDDVMLDADMAASITMDRIRLQNNKSFSVLFEMSSVSNSDKSGREYLAKYGWPLAKQVSILCINKRSFSIASFYISISKPIVPTQLFQNESKAVHYLGSLK